MCLAVAMSQGFAAYPSIEPVSPILLASEVACARLLARTSTDPATRVVMVVASLEDYG